MGYIWASLVGGGYRQEGREAEENGRSAEYCGQGPLANPGYSEIENGPYCV